jgi:hypothetical protein
VRKQVWGAAILIFALAAPSRAVSAIASKQRYRRASSSHDSWSRPPKQRAAFGTARLLVAESAARRRGVDYHSEQIERQERYQGDAPGKMKAYIVSNEGRIGLWFPRIRKLSGGIVGVGSDQVLDLFAAGSAKLACIVEYTESTSLFTRTLLEIGMYHKKTFGRHPASDQLISYLDDHRLPFLKKHILSRNFTSAQTSQVIEALQRGRMIRLEGDRWRRVPLPRYLRQKRLLTENGEPQSWLAKDSSIRRVLDAYEDHRIYVLRGDVTSPDVHERLREISDQHGTAFDVFYLSNAEAYMEMAQLDALHHGLASLPKGPQAVILRTSQFGKEKLAPVTTDPWMRKLLLDWRYSAQAFRDWDEKVGRSDSDLNGGMTDRQGYAARLLARIRTDLDAGRRAVVALITRAFAVLKDHS